MKLQSKQARFVAEYLIDHNGTKAALWADYSAKSARTIGAENLTKPHIAAAISAAQEKRAERIEITQDWVVEELRKLAAANMADYLTADGDLDLTALTRDQTAALAEVTCHRRGHRKSSGKVRDPGGTHPDADLARPQCAR
jgi:phage terminase small subunit